MTETLTTKEHTEAHGDKIKGYRKLSEDEIETINQIKAMGEQLGFMVAGIESLKNVDRRWLAIAQTDLQKGIMALVRAVAKPEGF